MVLTFLAGYDTIKADKRANKEEVKQKKALNQLLEVEGGAGIAAISPILCPSGSFKGDFRDNLWLWR